MSVFVLNMTTMIGLGRRHRLLAAGGDPVPGGAGAAAHGGERRRSTRWSTAGRAVITSGLTVVVGFGALLLTPLIETRSVGHRRAHRRGGGGPALDHAAPRPARAARPRDRPAPLAGPPARLVPRAAGVGEVGPHAEPPPDPRHGATAASSIAMLTLPVFWIRIGLPSRHWWPSGTEAGEGLDVLSPDGRGRLHPAGPDAGARPPSGGPWCRRTSLRGLRDPQRLAPGRPAGARGPEPGGPGAEGSPARPTRCSTAT